MTKDISDKKFFITGGGTGGHIYPAVSVADELLTKGVKKENIFYIGNKNNLEYKIVTDKGYHFLNVDVQGMPRKLTPKFFLWGFKLFISILIAISYILKYKPDIIFATGGYVTAPALFAAKILKIPYVLHDSDCYPGIVTKNFASGAKAVNLAFEDAKKYIKSKNIVHLNNPVRAAFFDKTKKDARDILKINDEFLILIMGGSQGAMSINRAAVDFIQNKKDENIKIILQTGKKNYDEVTKNLAIPKNAQIVPYFDDSSIPVIASDLIVSRAGSISISEILSSKTPSILVPYPYAAADHQRINAKAIVNKNAAIYIEDEELKEGKLQAVIEDLLLNKEKYNKLKENAEILGADFKNSASKLTELVIGFLK